MTTDTPHELTEAEKESLWSAIVAWVDDPTEANADAVERLAAGAATHDDRLRALADEIEERIEHVSDEDVDRGGFEVGMNVGLEIAYTEVVRRLREKAAVLDAAPAPTEEES